MSKKIKFNDDILFCGQGAGVLAVECNTGIFEALEENDLVPGHYMTSSGSTLFSSLYCSVVDKGGTEWFKDLMERTTEKDFFVLKELAAVKTVCSCNNYMFDNSKVFDLLNETLTGESFRRVTTSVTRNSDYKSLMKKVTPAWALAATSIPLVFKPVKIGDEFYSDGGLLNNIPVPTVEETKNWKHIFVFLSPATKYKNEKDDFIIETLINLLNAIMDREVAQLEEMGYFDLPNVTLIRPPSGLSGSLLKWSKNYELRKMCYEYTKEILENVEID